MFSTCFELFPYGLFESGPKQGLYFAIGSIGLLNCFWSMRSLSTYFVFLSELFVRRVCARNWVFVRRVSYSLHFADCIPGCCCIALRIFYGTMVFSAKWKLELKAWWDSSFLLFLFAFGKTTLWEVLCSSIRRHKMCGCLFLHLSSHWRLLPRWFFIK